MKKLKGQRNIMTAVEDAKNDEYRREY